MSYGVMVEAWGPTALFSRPELSVERVSYDVITPSAARGLIESVYWHPGLRYHIDKIHVLNPIKFTSLRKNEVKSKALASSMRTATTRKGELPSLYTGNEIVQRASMMLTDVRYVVEAHFELTDKATKEDNPGKFKDILTRRLRKGQVYSQPYFGTRECAANVREWTREDDKPQGCYSDAGERDFGLMLYDMDYSDPNNITPMFYRAIMNNGVIDVAGSEVLR